MVHRCRLLTGRQLAVSDRKKKDVFHKQFELPALIFSLVSFRDVVYAALHHAMSSSSLNHWAILPGRARAGAAQPHHQQLYSSLDFGSAAHRYEQALPSTPSLSQGGEKSTSAVLGRWGIGCPTKASVLG